MCGIAGFIGRGRVPEERLQSCLDRMGHRGPDHAAHRGFDLPRGGRVELLHTRLSIIDLDPRSHQPLTRGQLHLVYNGELYNYRELGAELRSEGVPFSTDSDTEVLASALSHWGDGALARFEGMWAYGMYREGSDALELCRDRFGEKPLLFCVRPEGTYFGSEAKFIFELMGEVLPVNHQQLLRHCINGYKALFKNPEQIFHGLESCPPGSTLTLGVDGRRKMERYWFPRFAPDESMSFEDAVRGTRQALIRSLQLRLRADVPLAFCLSGGIDSNALVSLAQKHLGYDVHGFSILDDDERYDESRLISKAVEHLGIRHTGVRLSTEGFLENLEAQILHHDGPICTITYYAHDQLLRRIAAEGYRISISGTGADEGFSGYYDHHLLYLHHLWVNHRDAHGEAESNWMQHIAPIVRNEELQDPRRFINDPSRRRHIFFRNEEFSALLRKPWREEFEEKWFCEDLMRNRMMNEMFHEIVPPILREDDLNAMCHSVENRSPFLDRELYEFSLTIPTRHLVKDGFAKCILREAVRPEAASEVIDCRQKVGFNVPIARCLDLSDESIVERLLAPSPIFEWIDPRRMEPCLRMGDDSNSASKFLFNFLNMKIFLDHFDA